jgi:hypothetical protein
LRFVSQRDGYFSCQRQEKDSSTSGLKAPAGRLSPEQKAFGDALTAAGGLYLVVRDVREVEAMLALIGKA